MRIGVKEGSAYDLHLSRTLEHATLERGPEGIDTYSTGRSRSAPGSASR